jgi:dihydroneopterin aldolase
MSQIHITQLKVMASIGCETFEKAIKQPIFIDLQFDTDIEKAAKTDDIKDAIDYTKVCQAMIETVQSQHHQLIETLASKLADTLEHAFGLTNFNLTLSKPTAIKEAKNIAISINRGA